MFLGHGNGRFEGEDLQVGQGRFKLLSLVVQRFELVDVVGGLDTHDFAGVVVSSCRLRV